MSITLKKIIEEIESDVIDVTRTNFIYSNTGLVPSLTDSDLTYERGMAKRGKYIQTCVLYVDIRNSVALTEKHHTQTMGRIYTAFTKAVLKLARYHNGHTRNIIGDRIMVVFPSENCYTNAVDCAISINYTSQKIINKYFKDVEFKCGIGIDFGGLRVIKVGIQRNGTEHGENKGLVWVGYPANLASRLTDIANKEITETYYEVTRNPINPLAIKPLYNRLLPNSSPSSRPFDFLSFLNKKPTYDPNAPLYLTTTEKIEMTPEEFANSIAQYDNGGLFTSGGKLIKFEKKTRTILYPNILMSDDVYKGLKAANPQRKCIIDKYWTEQEYSIKNVSGKVYGGSVSWVL